MRNILIATGLLLFSTVSPANESPMTLNECHIKGIKEQVQCGTLKVPENYQRPEGRKIDINVTILPAIDNTSTKEPLMFLAGGPGQAATELAAHIRRAFTEVRKTRNVILVDQRGTGKSSPLVCEENNLAGENIYTSTMTDLNAEDIRECVASFKQDLSQYNSENAIRDFDAVRSALGIDKINLYGGSYGTRAALVYMRLFPQNIRSVVLDSVGPIEVPIGPFGQSSARSYNLLLENCFADEACKAAFPELDKEYQAVFSQLVQQPVTVTIPHPRLGSMTDFVIDADKFASVIHLQLYSMSGRSVVPLVIHQASLGNYLPLAGILSQRDTEEVEGGIYLGLMLNILCNEDFPKIGVNDWNADANNNFSRNISHRLLRFSCPLWPKFRPDESFYQSVKNDIPTLILSGKLDPVTPPSNGEFTDSSLLNSRHIVVDNASHIVAGNQCALRLVDQFLDELDLEALDETCLTELPKVSFMTSLNGNT